jgi:myo-inositol-1(or 4)-monophosphatase
LTRTFEDTAFVDRILETAREAGALALPFFRPGERTLARFESKEGGSPVTEADRRVDDFLHERLGALLPDAGWLSEETADTDARLSRKSLFIVDPIDGTRAFMAGDARWAVCIALVTDGRPVLGVVHLPARQETYVAAAGEGAFRNDAPIRVSPRPGLEGARIAGPMSVLKALARDGLAFETEPRIPSLAYRLVRVADGSLDAGLASTNACDWDIAAADIILHEAGGRLTDLDGRAPQYNRVATRHGLLSASADQLHRELTNALRRALEERATS